MKDRWSKPQLIILARGTPEENVLVGCKTQGGVGVSPQTAQTGCIQDCANCVQCAEIVNS